MWNPAAHLRHIAAQHCPSATYSRFIASEYIGSKCLCLLRFVASTFGHLLASRHAVGSFGTSLSATEPKNQGNSGSAIVSGQNSQWDCLLPIEPTNHFRPPIFNFLAKIPVFTLRNLLKTRATFAKTGLHQMNSIFDRELGAMSVSFGVADRVTATKQHRNDV